MKSISKSVIVGLAAAALALPSRAAPVTWGPVQSITGPSNIISTGVTSLAGANFGITTGTTTVVNNGSVDIEFKSLNSGQNVTLSNGLNVAAAGTWGNWGLNGAISNVGGTFETVLDYNLGDEDAPLESTITLSGLSIGTQYQIQFFAAATASRLETISGSGTLDTDTGSNGQFVTGTFTADATSQVLTVTGPVEFVVANALTIGAVGVAPPDTTPPSWIAGWPQAAPLSPTALTVRAKADETGTAYYVVLADGAAAPSAAQVKAGNDSTNSVALASGSLALTANTEATGPVTDLTAATTYNVYFVAEDAVPNLQASPLMVSASTGIGSATITWGAATNIAGVSDIDSSGLANIAGANFGVTTGTTTPVNNGSVDVEFKSLASGQSAALSNGITVAASSDWVNWGPAGGNSSIPGNFGIVLDSNLGMEVGAPVATTVDFTLSGLAIGTQYRVQFFADSTGSNAQSVSGSGSMNSLNGQFVTGTFTADAVSQVLSVTYTGGDFAVANALTIGIVSGGGDTFGDWISGYTGLNGQTGFNDDADGDGIENGLENFFGTPPNAGNAGLIAGTLSGNTFTFTHPQNATPASDVSVPAYAWSTDLQTFHANGASADGITVNLEAVPNNPTTGTTTVTATVTGTVPSKLFVNVGVTQP
ncbi:MAG: hypothetical protein K9N23_05155 [Akkermansiaceae bacterium]|nr:hypothetical protein [Akkermansiaceae bacterium]MCF7731050.1 hypothetical protein [Akkermansiaceae bacterium]